MNMFFESFLENKLHQIPIIVYLLITHIVYLGDSASLSYLQLIRVIIEGVVGPSPFTQDPQRHRIVENTIVLPHNIQLTRLLPDKTTACILLEAYFINV